MPGRCRARQTRRAGGIYAADSFFQWDVFFLRHEEFCVIAFVLEFCYYALGDFSIVGCFDEFSVRRSFAGSVVAVAGVEEDFHVVGGRQLFDSE